MARQPRSIPLPVLAPAPKVTTPFLERDEPEEPLVQIELPKKPLRETATHAPSRLFPVLLGLLALVYAARVGPPAIYPAWGFDSSISLVSAKALAEGRGPRLINHPDAPVSPYIPVGYPAMLAAGLRFVSLDANGITLLRGISVLTCLIFLFLSYRLLRYYLPPRGAALTTFLVGFHPWVVLWAGELFTECPFAMWAAAAVLLARRSLADGPAGEGRAASGGVRRWWLAVAAAGVCAGLAMLTRAVGCTLIAGILMALALNRRWRECFVFALTSGATAVPWLVWSSLYGGGGSFKYYVSWVSSQYHWWTPLDAVWRLMVKTVPGIYFAPIGTPDGQMIFQRLHLAWLFPILGVIFSAFFLGGLIALLKRRDVVACCLVFYLTLVLLYPSDPSRYLMPAYALLAIPVITAGRWLWHVRESNGLSVRGLKVTLVALLALMVAGSLVTNALRISYVYTSGHFYGPKGARDWRDLNAAFEWIKRDVPPNAVVVTLYSCGTYLFTDRQTISPYHDVPNSTTPPGSTARLEEVLSKIDPGTPLYIFARDFYLDDQEISVAPLKGLLAEQPERLRLRWETPDHKLMIYEVTRPGNF